MSSTCEHVVDRLSSLPQDVLSYILSLMPTKFAVRTSLLSKTWRYTWTFVHNLDFDTIDARKYMYVDWVLERCKTSHVKIFRVQFSYHYDLKSYSRELISKAIRFNVHELDIEGWDLRLPSSLYICKTLTRLKLDSNKSPTMDTFPNCSSLVNLPNLKTLDVVIDGIYWESALKLIHGCPVLENLYVKMGCWKGDTYFKIPTLKRLNLKVTELITDTVILNLPNLKYFLFDGCMSFPFVIEEMTSLIEAKASCRVYRSDGWVRLLKGISQAKSISLNTPESSHYYFELRYFDLPKFFPNLKQLELEGYVGHHWNLLPQFLERSPKLEHLSIGTVVHDFLWNKLKSIPTCMRVNLKTVKFTNPCVYHDLRFLKFILSYSKVLKTVSIDCDTRFTVRANLTKLRKASKKVRIVYGSGYP